MRKKYKKKRAMEKARMLLANGRLHAAYEKEATRIKSEMIKVSPVAMPPRHPNCRSEVPLNEAATRESRNSLVVQAGRREGKSASIWNDIAVVARAPTFSGQEIAEAMSRLSHLGRLGRAAGTTPENRLVAHTTRCLRCKIAIGPMSQWTYLHKDIPITPLCEQCFKHLQEDSKSTIPHNSKNEELTTEDRLRDIDV